MSRETISSRMRNEITERLEYLLRLRRRTMIQQLIYFNILLFNILKITDFGPSSEERIKDVN